MGFLSRLFESKGNRDFVQSIPAKGGLMAFTPNRKFKKRYDKIFKKNPEAANLFLLLAELADEKGQVATNEEDLAELMAVRFEDPGEYAL